MAPYVTLKSKLDESMLVCDTPAKAVKALDELGMCSNQAVLTTFEGQGQRVPLLMYQGVRYKASSECWVNLPFSEYESDLGSKIQQLLQKIFEPFVFPQYFSKRSYITMNPDPGDSRCFLFNLCLIPENLFYNLSKLFHAYLIPVIPDVEWLAVVVVVKEHHTAPRN